MTDGIDSTGIDSTLKEDRVIACSPDFTRSAHIKSEKEYAALYAESMADPDTFWAKQAERELHWSTPWKTVVESDFEGIGTKTGPYVKFFSGGELNVSYNCLDRHIQTKRADKIALIWHGEPAGERQTLTYRELHREVCLFANALKTFGIKKGSTVTLCMPMIPQAAVAMLACARIGAIHSVVFSAFSAESLKSRIQSCKSELVITADAGYHAGKIVELKTKVDTALAECPSVKKVIVFKRANTEIKMQTGRDHWWHDAVSAPGVTADCPAAPFESETPLFLLFTSGSTGKPKGVMHTSAGYLLQAHLTFKYYFDHQENDIYWCTADVGWVTGHSYVVYGPLSNGATVVMYEGAPLYPAADRIWKIIEQEKVSILYTAPTAIRMLMRLGDELPRSCDLSSLRLLGSVGEPINPEAWMWYRKIIGGDRCPIVDTWWQTETGGIMISTLPGAQASKPSSAGKPFFGVDVKILDDSGKEVAPEDGGSVVITRPWPGMIRGVYGDAKNETIKQVYFSKFPGAYFTGDGGRKDRDGYFWLLGRIDDVLNVSAHRLSTAELESALVGHTQVAEAAVVGFPHETKGQGVHCFVVLKKDVAASPDFAVTLKQRVRTEIGPIATPDRIQFCEGLPKTRSGKIMRRILRKIAEGKPGEVGDTSTLADPAVVDAIISGASFGA